MLKSDPQSTWSQFLTYIEERCSATEYANWLAPIRAIKEELEEVTLEVPNIFVQQYLIDNYKQELAAFLPLTSSGEPAVRFLIAPPADKPKSTIIETAEEPLATGLGQAFKLNTFYTFDNFIEGATNQFVKSAAFGVAHKPGKSYNPLFIHGGVGLGKTHLLHAIGHYVRQHHKKLRMQCITTEAFINELVSHLRNKSLDKMKNFYRSLDILLVDDIQFLQNRLNFEEEFCNTFESLFHQNKQIVITSDKAPGQLNLSERIVARMEWGLVAHVAVPDLETRVAILQHKAEKKGMSIPQNIAFFIAEHIFSNIRQLEGALNRLSAFCRIHHTMITEEVVEKTLRELLHHAPQKKISVEDILKCVATLYEVRLTDLRSTSRTKEIAFPRQVAMYLAKELIDESLMKLASAFGGKTHSTLLHAWKKIGQQVESDDTLKQHIHMLRRNLE